MIKNWSAKRAGKGITVKGVLTAKGQPDQPIKLVDCIEVSQGPGGPTATDRNGKVWGLA